MTDQIDNKYGVLLFENAWKELGEALKLYQQEGPIGKYLYCKELCYDGPMVEMTFTPEQVDNKIDCVMHISVPSNFIKFIAQAADSNRAPIGFGQEQTLR